MARNPVREKAEAAKETPDADNPGNSPQDIQVVEREITLALLNDKINYMTGLLHEIAKACDVEIK